MHQMVDVSEFDNEYRPDLLILWIILLVSHTTTSISVLIYWDEKKTEKVKYMYNILYFTHFLQN